MVLVPIRAVIACYFTCLISHLNVWNSSACRGASGIGVGLTMNYHVLKRVERAVAHDLASNKYSDCSLISLNMRLQEQ